MEKADTNPVFWTGHAIGALIRELNSAPTANSLFPVAAAVREHLAGFTAHSHLFTRAKNKAGATIAMIDEFFATKMAAPPDGSDIPPPSLQAALTQDEINRFFGIIYEFQVVFLSEVAQANIYYASPKRAYDSAALIDYGESLLALRTIEALTLSKAKVLADIQAAGRCLAFNLPTAVGFHIYRVIEAIVVEEYFPLHGITKPDNRNLGSYIKLLEGVPIDVKVTTMLRHIKDYYRNPISHPEEFWDQENAEGALGVTVSVITLMMQDIINTRIAKDMSQPQGEE